MRVLLTGAEGFLGWHTRVRLRALTGHDVVAVTRASWPELARLAAGADAILHVAGVNRGTDHDVEEGNVTLARDVADAARAAGSAPRIVFANSVQAGTDGAYGAGKQAAADVLARAAARLGSAFVDVRLPNLFGEHGRPGYNSFVATFVDAIVRGAQPEVTDRPVELLHAQGAAQALLDALTSEGGASRPAGTPVTVAGVLRTLRELDALYALGDVPPLRTELDLDLFNTLRAARFPAHAPLALTQRTDDRGGLIEVVRAHGGPGQTFASTTRPGSTRGEHFHLRKFERFAVLSGTARISLRRLFTTDVVSFDVSGARPTVVDMPTLWAHNLTNTGPGELLTLFWTDGLFDPAAPDTFAEAVAPRATVLGSAR